MKALTQILTVTILIILCITSVKSQDTTVIFIKDGKSYRIGDSCKVTCIDNSEIYGVLVSVDEKSLKIMRENTMYSISLDNVEEVSHTALFPRIIYRGESEMPSCNYTIYLKDNSVTKCKPMGVEEDSLLITNGYKKSKLYIDDIKKVVHVKPSGIWTGAFYGGLLGGITFPIIGAIIDEANKNDNRPYDPKNPYSSPDWFPDFKGLERFGEFILGALSGALVGGIIGAVVSEDDEYSLKNKDKERRIKELRKIINEK